MKQPANRTAALGASAAAVVAVLVTLLGAVDTDRKAAVLVAAILVIGILAAVFLRGSQRFDALLARSADLTRELEADAERPASTTIVNAPSAKTVDTGGERTSAVVESWTDRAAGEDEDSAYLVEPVPEGHAVAEDPS